MIWRDRPVWWDLRQDLLLGEQLFSNPPQSPRATPFQIYWVIKMRFLRWLVRCKNLHEIINIRHCLLVMNCGRRLWTMHIPNVPDNIMMILMTMVVMGCGCKLWTFCTFSYENVQSSCNVPRSGQSHVEREVCAYLKCLQLLSECFPFSFEC